MSKAKKISKIPEDCGYNKQFKYNVPLCDYGVDSELINWCQTNCKSKWGWHFNPTKNYLDWIHNYEEQTAFMSFNSRKEAFRFWFENTKNFGIKKYTNEF